MITLMEMLKDKKVDPAAGRPLDITRIYMANVMSSGEAVLLAKKQKLAEARGFEKQAMGFPPLEGGNGAGGGVPAAKNT